MATLYKILFFFRMIAHLQSSRLVDRPMAQSSILYYHNFLVSPSHYYKKLKITLTELSNTMHLLPPAMNWKFRWFGGLNLLPLLHGEP